MANFLQGLGQNLLGTGSSNNTAQDIWNVGQFQPFSVNNPMGQVAFQNGSANSSLSPVQQQLGGLFGNQITGNFGSGATNYNPNTSFLPSQYSSLYGSQGAMPGVYGSAGFLQNQGAGLLNSNSNFNQNWNSLFNNSVQAQSPYIQQFLQSNQDNEFSKGTLASTAGQYQTMGADQSVLNNLNTMQNNAFNNAANLYSTNLSAGTNMLNAGGQLGLGATSNQFGAAGTTANLGEQQAEFGPQLATSQNNSAFSNLLNQGSFFNASTQLGGQLGAQQSAANVNAAYPSLGVAQQQDTGTSALLNGLLFGNGTGGVLNSLFGGSGSNSNSLGGFLGNQASNLVNLLSGTGTPGSMSQTQLNNLMGGNSNVNYTGANDSSNQPYYDPNSDVENSSGGVGNSVYANSGGLIDSSELDDLLGFTGASGQAANQGGSNLADSELQAFDNNDSSGNSSSSNSSSSGLSANGALGAAGSLYGAVTGIMQGTPQGYAKAALSGLSAAGTLSKDPALNGIAGFGGNILGLASGIQQGGTMGDLNAAVNAAGLLSKADTFFGGTIGSAAAPALGAIAAPLALYSAVTNWKTGDTLGDAANFASAGAAIGSIIPGVGTLIGGLAGAAIGALSSGFGPLPDPSAATMSSFNGAAAQDPAGYGPIDSAMQSYYSQHGTLNGFFNDLNSLQKVPGLQMQDEMSRNPFHHET
jgi:hypothetical protein